MNARGQGTVELALGSLLVLTTLMLGLWLTEVSFLSVKVQEASAAAVWNATGRPLDDYSDPSDPTRTTANYQQLLIDVERDLTSQYRDFDGVGAGGNGTARLFTQGQNLAVDCEPTASSGPGALVYNVPAFTRGSTGNVVPAQVNAQLRRWYQPRGATICTASANTSTYELPQTYLDKSKGGFFTAFRGTGKIRLCGAGRALGQQCQAGYAVLLGDWALDGRAGTPMVRDTVLPESRGQPPMQSNVPYRQMVRTLFVDSGQGYNADAAGNGASGRFAAKLSMRLNPPGTAEGHRDRKFYMSYSGSEHAYGDQLKWRFRPSGTQECWVVCHFNTAGTQPVHGNPSLNNIDDWRNRRQPCFLGLGGCQ
jgi:hypothetical protein